MNLADAGLKLRERFASHDSPRWLRRLFAITKILYRDAVQANLPSHATSMAYTTLISIVPFLAMTFAIISAFQPIADPNAQWFDTFRAFVLSNLAPDTGAEVVNYLETFLLKLDITRIGLSGTIGVLITVVLLLRNIELAFNEIWVVSQPRTLFRRFLFFWTFCTMGAFLLSLALGVLARFDLANIVPFWGSGLAQQNDMIYWFLSVLATYAFFVLLYKIGPNCSVSTRSAMVGALVGALSLRIGNVGFSVYALNNNFYENVYGAVAALPFFLLWLYISWLIILFGSIVAWRTEQGFDISAAMDETIGQAHTSVEIERNTQIRAIMPLICVLAVNRWFIEARRQGPTGHQIATTLELPLSWANEALRVATDLGYLVRSSSPGAHDDDAPDESRVQYFPSLPPTELTLGQIFKDLTAASQSWLAARQAHETRKIQDLLQAFLRLSNETWFAMDIAQVIAKADDKP